MVTFNYVFRTMRTDLIPIHRSRIFFVIFLFLLTHFKHSIVDTEYSSPAAAGIQEIPPLHLKYLLNIPVTLLRTNGSIVVI